MLLSEQLVLHRIQRSFWALLAAVATTGLSPRNVQANGAFPAVSQLVADPADPTHLVLRSNFGLLISHDQGDQWDLVCEAGVGYQNVDPAIAVLDDGTTIAALPNGIAHSETECAFDLGAGVADYVADVARSPDGPGAAAAVAVSVDIDAGVSRVWRSLDAGRSWSQLGNALPDLNATTLDVAANDRNTLYVSGVAQSRTVTGVLARSSDGGQTWTRSEVPGASKLSAPYIAAIAARDSNTVYVRLSGTPGTLLVSHDGGAGWKAALDFTGPVDGFALSPDGRFALASGRVDGVWRASTSELAFERVSCTKLRCLSWTHAGLFACADEFQAGFLVGESTDSGASFQPRLHLSCVRGPLACAADSPVANACDASWPAQSEVLGSDCANAGFTPRDECSSAGGASGGAGAIAGASATAGAAGTNLGRRVAGGCSFSTRTKAPWLAPSALVTVFGWARRRWARIRKARPG